MSHLCILLKLLPQSLNGVSIAKANQFLLTSPWEGVALHCCSNCIVSNVPLGCFYSYHVCFCMTIQQSDRSVLLFLPHTDLLLVAGAAAFTASQLGRREVHSCICQTLPNTSGMQCVSSKLFLGQNMGGSRFDRILSFTCFFWELLQLWNPPVFQWNRPGMRKLNKAMPVARFSFHWPLCYDHALVAITDYEIWDLVFNQWLPAIQMWYLRTAHMAKTKNLTSSYIYIRLSR